MSDETKTTAEASNEEIKLKDFLKSIETDAVALLKKIEAIPQGVQHGWHTLAAEITARRL